MRKIFYSVLVSLFLIPNILSAKSAKGLNVILTAKNPQTQLMAMVLSMKTLKQGKKVNMVLCSNAGALGEKNSKSKVLKPIDKSPKMMLKALIKNGANVKVCPLYLPNVNKDKSVLLEGIKVAKPEKVANMLLDTEFKNLSY